LAARPSVARACRSAGLDALRELDLLLRVEQRHLADLVQVDPDEVGGDRRALLVEVGQGLLGLLDRRIRVGRLRPHRATLRTVGPRHDARLDRRAAARRDGIGARKGH
jgi:hypothetical protein